MTRQPEPDDWRRQGQERFLKGVKMVARPYAPKSQEWEHDHCEFCSVKFAVGDSNASAGYVSEDGYHWVCAECFNDFKLEYGWVDGGDANPE